MDNRLIIWDWNGTLLNDVDACVQSMNIMLRKRKMDSLSTSRYKNIFTFPVKNYYENIGFNFNDESFEQLSVEYIDLYKQEALKSPLQPRALEALIYFKSKGYSQIILSASEQKALEMQVKERNITDYFESLLGLNNIYAKSKLNNAIDYIKKSAFMLDQIVFIGDTFHDYEVAKAIGCESILVNNGHQDLKRFNFDRSGSIVSDLGEISEKMAFRNELI